MIEKEIVVKIPSGLEARPAALFVQVASKFNSHVYVVINEKKVNAKSIMGMMSLGVIEGETIIIGAEGEDEEQAIAELMKFLTDTKEVEL
ncbi:MAG: HPr family phosphocarrier protein [Epulopiscium sp.]|nr:HPr family phosphocarrier protein [Candidatus Epulonipiscium sp.]